MDIHNLVSFLHNFTENISVLTKCQIIVATSIVKYTVLDYSCYINCLVCSVRLQLLHQLFSIQRQIIVATSTVLYTVLDYSCYINFLVNSANLQLLHQLFSKQRQVIVATSIVQYKVLDYRTATSIVQYTVLNYSCYINCLVYSARLQLLHQLFSKQR